MAIRRGWSCSFLELVQKQNNNKQKGAKKKPCAVEMERSDPPALRTGNDKLRNSFKLCVCVVVVVVVQFI